MRSKRRPFAAFAAPTRGTLGATIEGVKGFLVGLVLLVGCGGDQIDSFIGAECTRDSQCEERCFQGGNYPGGFCSIACASDNDCPSDTVCIEHDGGVCMFLCSELDCSRLGPRWGCHDEDRRTGGKDNVCIGD